MQDGYHCDTGLQYRLIGINHSVLRKMNRLTVLLI